jgi:Flp pilus assembly protein TadD
VKEQVALGRATVTVGEVDDATTVFRRAISLQPKDSSARLGLANALASQGEVDSAIGEYRLGISLWVPMTRMLTTIFPICSNEREISTVRLQNTVWDCSWIPRMATAAATWACYQIKKGDLDGAIEKMRLALHYGHEILSAHYQLGRALEKKGDLDAALKE